MRIFPSPIQIGDTEGFTAANDIFGRHELGSGLTNLVGSVTESMVIAVDGQWGTGKTTFLKMWAGQLRQHGFPVIYFDAFENDYMDDAFSAIAAEIIGLIDAKKKAKNPKAKAFVSKAIGAGRVIARSALKVGVKVATAGALAATDFEELADAVSSEVEDVTDKHIGELLTRQAERRDTLQAFRDALRDLPSILASPETNRSEADVTISHRPLIFIIDELDRCKPIYALHLLERIKHFFSVPNVHFVLGTHMGQLRTSVGAAYGLDIDATTYLQKFISLTFPLTDHASYAHERSASKYIEHLSKDLEIAPDDRDFARNCIGFVRTYALMNGISLRDIEHIMTNVALAVAFTNNRTLRPPPLIAGLSILRVARPSLYIKAKQGTLTYNEAEEALGLNREFSNEEDKAYSKWEKGWWEYALKQDAQVELIEKYNGAMFQYSVNSRFSIIPLVAHRVVDKLTANKNA